MRDEEPHVELRSGSKGRPSEAGRQPVVEEKGAGEQTNISPQADKYCKLKELFLCKSKMFP